MSQRRFLEFEIRGHPGNADTIFNRLNAGLTSVDRKLTQHQRNLNTWNKQLLAIGTTIRYALAGGLIFGIVGAIQKLGEFEAQLGVIGALAGKLNSQGTLVGIGDQLDTVRKAALDVSIDLGIAATDVEDYMQRFFSSFDPPGGAKQKIQQMREFSKIIGGLQIQFGREAGDPGVLASGVAGFIQGIPGGNQNITKETKRMANIISYTLGETPGLKGTDISNSLGRLSGAQTTLRMSPEEIFAFYGTAAKRAGSPAVIARGVTQALTSSLFRPRSKDEKAAFASMGLPTEPGALRQMGGWPVIRKILQTAQGSLGGLSGGQIQTLKTTEDPAEALNGVNLSAPGINTLAKAFGRTETLRQFLSILSVGGVDALEKFKKGIEDGTKANIYKQREEVAQRQRFIQQFGAARAALSIEIAEGFRWPIQGATKGMQAVAHAGAAHPHVVQALEAVAGTVAGAAAVNKLSGGRLFGGKSLLGKLTGGMRTAASTALQAEATPNVLAGGIPTGSRDNPFWVIIHPETQLFTDMGGSGSGGGKPSGSRGWLGKLGKYGAGAAGGVAARAGAIGIGASAAATAAALLSAEATRELLGNKSNRNMFFDDLKGSWYYRAGAYMSQGHGGDDKVWRYGHLVPRNTVNVEGQATIDLNLSLRDPKTGKPIFEQKVPGVPVKLWGARQAPTVRGRPRGN